MTLADTARRAQLHPAGNDRIRVITDLMTIVATAADTGGAYTLVMSETPPGGGWPIAARRYDDTGLFVLDGTYLVRAGDRELSAGPGDHLFVPRGTPLGYVNAGAGAARMLVLTTPGGVQERFLDEIGDAESRAQWAVDMARVLAVAPKYGIEFFTDGTGQTGGAPG